MFFSGILIARLAIKNANLKHTYKLEIGLYVGNIYIIISTTMNTIGRVYMIIYKE